MTQHEGIRTASLSELEEGLHVLCDQMRQDVVFSPLWKASSYWLNRTYGEIRRRQDEEPVWSAWCFASDPGDEA